MQRVLAALVGLGSRRAAEDGDQGALERALRRGVGDGAADRRGLGLQRWARERQCEEDGHRYGQNDSYSIHRTLPGLRLSDYRGGRPARPLAGSYTLPEGSR